MAAGTRTFEDIIIPSPAARPGGTLHPGSAPSEAGAAVGAAALPKASGPLSARAGVHAGVQPHLAGALQAAATARAVAARIRATVEGGSTPAVPEQPGSAVAANGSIWRGLSVAEAAAAASISFRPLRRPFGRLPHGAPQSDLKPVAVAALAHDAPRSEPAATSAPSQAGMPRRVARTIAELERLRRAARLRGDQPQSLLMGARA